MKSFWLILFISSAVLLFVVLLKTKSSRRWLFYTVLNVALAAVLLYCVNGLAPYTHFRIAINEVTMLTAGILGIPGFLLLVGTKLWLV